MTNCFFCNANLTKVNGMKKIGIPLTDGEFAVVEIDSPLHCEDCQESYVDTEQLLEGFNQIQDSLGDTKTITKGIYN